MTQEKPIVLITGCSSGFGLLTTVELAKEYRVIATMRDLSKQDDLQAAMKNAGVSAHLYACDVTCNNSIATLVEHIEKEFGHIDILINNAGYAIAGFFEDLSEEETRAVMDTNFFGLQAVTRQCLPLLRKGNAAKIINLSSIAGVASSPSLSAYNASKWAVEGFSEALLFELLPFGIDVVLIQPGPFNTKIFHGNLKMAEQTNSEESLYYHQSQRLFNRLKRSLDKGLDDPIHVVNVIHKAIRTKKPKFRYLVGGQAKLRAFLKRYLPFSWYKTLVEMKLKRL